MPIATTVYIGSVTAIFYDIVILILPVPMVLKLQMNNRKKVGLLALFLLGVFTTVCSIMRLTQVKSIISGADVTGIILWGTVEMNVGVSHNRPIGSAFHHANEIQVILTCLPTLLPLIKYYADKKNSSNHPSYPLESRGSAGLRSGRSKNRSMNISQAAWEERDSVDNSSQNTILRQQGISKDYVPEDSLGYEHAKFPIQGILTTTEVEIHSSDATTPEVEREIMERKQGGKW